MYGARNHKQYSLQAGILKNCDEQYNKMILYYSTFICSNNFTMNWYYKY
jgi:hypothetical protein